MAVYTLLLKADKDEPLAELKMTSSKKEGSEVLLNYACVLDGNTAEEIVLPNVPKRADPMQTAIDALSAFGYSPSKRKPLKAPPKKKGVSTPQDIR